MTRRVITSGERGFLVSLRSNLKPLDGWGSFRRGARRAAVVAALYRRHGEWHLPFVRRRSDLPDHPGQVALPGGTVREGETAWEAAARELAEEIGVSGDGVRPLGAGEPVYTAVSNFSVVPFVAFLPNPEARFAHDPGELTGLLQVPLARLLAEAAWQEDAEVWRGRYFPWGDAVVWGLTARILADLMPRFRRALVGC